MTGSSLARLLALLFLFIFRTDVSSVVLDKKQNLSELSDVQVIVTKPTGEKVTFAVKANEDARLAATIFSVQHELDPSDTVPKLVGYVNEERLKSAEERAESPAPHMPGAFVNELFSTSITVNDTTKFIGFLPGDHSYLVSTAKAALDSISPTWAKVDLGKLVSSMKKTIEEESGNPNRLLINLTVLASQQMLVIDFTANASVLELAGYVSKNYGIGKEGLRAIAEGLWNQLSELEQGARQFSHFGRHVSMKVMCPPSGAVFALDFYEFEDTGERIEYLTQIIGMPVEATKQLSELSPQIHHAVQRSIEAGLTTATLEDESHGLPNDGRDVGPPEPEKAEEEIVPPEFVSEPSRKRREDNDAPVSESSFMLFSPLNVCAMLAIGFWAWFLLTNNSEVNPMLNSPLRPTARSLPIGLKQKPKRLPINRAIYLEGEPLRQDRDSGLGKNVPQRGIADDVEESDADDIRDSSEGSDEESDASTATEVLSDTDTNHKNDKDSSDTSQQDSVVKPILTNGAKRRRRRKSVEFAPQAETNDGQRLRTRDDEHNYSFPTSQRTKDWGESDSSEEAMVDSFEGLSARSEADVVGTVGDVSLDDGSQSQCQSLGDNLDDGIVVMKWSKDEGARNIKLTEKGMKRKLSSLGYVSRRWHQHDSVEIPTSTFACDLAYGVLKGSLRVVVEGKQDITLISGDSVELPPDMSFAVSTDTPAVYVEGYRERE